MVERRELRWFRHLLRMDSNMKPKQVWETKSWGDAGKRIWGSWREKKGRTCRRQLGWRRTGSYSRSGWYNPTAQNATREYKKKKNKSFGILRHICWLIWRNISECLNFVICPLSCWRDTSLWFEFMLYVYKPTRCTKFLWLGFIFY